MADSIPIRGQQQINTVSRDFDEAIIVDILSRLPAKSLLRFCSVCKLWLTLISDPYFVKKHLSRVRTNCLKLLVGTRGSQAAIISKEDNGNVAITELDFPVKSFLPTIYGSCNGLICVEFECGNIIIWNPSTREFKRLPEAPTVDDDVPLGMPDPNELYWFGFGFDSTIEDYKVIRATETTMHVFTLKTGSWRMIKNMRDSLMPKGPQGWLLNETLHWVAIDWEDLATIVSFDLAEEIMGDERIWGKRIVDRSHKHFLRGLPKGFDYFKALCILETGEVVLNCRRGLGLYNPVKKTFRNVFDDCGSALLFYL